MGDRVTRADPPSVDEMGLLDIAAAVAAVITASGRIAAATYRTRSLAKGGGGREGHLPPPPLRAQQATGRKTALPEILQHYPYRKDE